MKNVIGVFGLSLLLVACGGGSKLTLDEANKVTLNYQGDNYTPPPRGVDKLVEEITSTDVGEIENNICRMCATMDPEDPNIKIRIQNLRKLGAVAHAKGYSQEALEYLKKGVSLLDSQEVKEFWLSGHRNPFDHTYIGILHVYSRVLMDVGNFSEGIKYLKKAIDINEGKIKPRKGKLVYEHASLAMAYASLGNVDEAEDALDKSNDFLSDLVEKGNSKRAQRFAIFHRQMNLMVNGVIQSALGNLRESENYYRKAINEMEEYTRGRKWRTWLMRAKVKGEYLVDNLLSQGRIAEAEAQSIVAIRYVLEKFGNTNHITAIILKSYIKVLIARERYDDAQKIISITNAIFDRIGAKVTSVARVKLKMSSADIYIAKGEWRKAKEIYLEIYHSLKSESEVRKELFYDNLNWAVVLSFNNQNSEAEKIALAAIEKNTGIFGRDHTNTAMARGVLALVKSRTGADSEAKELYETIIPIFVNSRDSDAISASDTQKMRLIIESYIGLLAKEYKNGNKKAAHRAFYITQLIQGKDAQNAVASSAVRASIKDSKLVKLVYQEQNTLKKIESGYNTMVTNYSISDSESKSLVKETKEKIDQLVKAREAILVEINNLFPDYANLVRSKPVEIEKIKTILMEDEFLLVTYSAANNLYTWTILSDGRVHFHSTKITKDELNSNVVLLRKALDLQVDLLKKVPVFDVELAHEFYNNILRPSAHLWRKYKTMVVISDGALSTVPFSMFVIEQPTKIKHRNRLLFSEYRKVAWLAKKHATSYVPSVSTLLNLRKLNVQKKPTMGFAGFGNPIFSKKSIQLASVSDSLTSRGVTKLNMRGLRKTNSGSLDNTKISTSQLDMLLALPETADEVMEVAKALKVSIKGSVFLGHAASEQRVKNMNLKNRRVIMFATHALLPGDLDGLVQPALALSSPTKALGSGENDGLLTMGEIMGLELNADWVVLSACNTGAASGKGAAAISGLGQAFFYAGARSLLVSHWPVETSSAKEITTGLFDRQTKNNSLTRSVALNETINDLINTKTFKNLKGDSIYAYSHPVFWAPFTVVGDGAGTLR